MDRYETIMGDVIHHARIEPDGYVLLYLKGGGHITVNPYTANVVAGVSTILLNDAIGLVFQILDGEFGVGEIFPMVR